MRYDVEVAITSLEPLRPASAALTEVMKLVGASVTVSGSHHVSATLTIEAHDLPEAINTGLDAWLAAMRFAGDGASAMSVSAARAE